MTTFYLLLSKYIIIRFERILYKFVNSLKTQAYNFIMLKMKVIQSIQIQISQNPRGSILKCVLSRLQTVIVSSTMSCLFKSKKH